MSWPGCCLSLVTSATTSPLMTCELFHARWSSRVEDATYLGAVHAVGEVAAGSRRPGGGEGLVGRPAQQQRVGGEQPLVGVPLVVVGPVRALPGFGGLHDA